MKAYEFPATVNADGNLALSEPIVKLPPNQTVRVIVLVPESASYDSDLTPEEEDATWTRFAAEQLLKQYTDTDAIYDEI